MIPARWLRALVPILLSVMLFTTGCAAAPTSAYYQTQRESTRRGATPAVAKKAEQGATFNKFFPGSTGTYEVVPAQEKKGFAEYKLKQNGKTVAVMSISDTTSVPSAAAKYETSTDKVSGYPAVEQGTTGTGILVNGRYQVKVLSRDPAFSKDDRVAWLQKFDLRGLAKLKPAIATTKPAPLKAPAVTDSAPKLPPVLSPQPAT